MARLELSAVIAVSRAATAWVAPVVLLPPMSSASRELSGPVPPTLRSNPMIVAVELGRASAWSVAATDVAAALPLTKVEMRAVPERSAAVLMSTLNAAVAIAVLPW